VNEECLCAEPAGVHAAGGRVGAASEVASDELPDSRPSPVTGRGRTGKLFITATTGRSLAPPISRRSTS
jgi:hypothetical protein